MVGNTILLQLESFGCASYTANLIQLVQHISWGYIEELYEYQVSVQFTPYV